MFLISLTAASKIQITIKTKKKRAQKGKKLNKLFKKQHQNSIKMSIKLQVSKEQIESSDEAKVHFIPAAINNNGVIHIDEYFNQYTEEENGGKSKL